MPEKCSGSSNRKTKVSIPIDRIKRILHLIGWQNELSLRHAKPYVSRMLIPLEIGNAMGRADLEINMNCRTRRKG